MTKTVNEHLVALGPTKVEDDLWPALSASLTTHFKNTVCPYSWSRATRGLASNCEAVVGVVWIDYGKDANHVVDFVSPPSEGRKCIKTNQSNIYNC